MAGVIGLRGPDIEKRDALRGYQVVWADADRPIIRPHTGSPVLHMADGKPVVGRHVFGFSRRFSSFNARDDKLEDGKMWKGLFGRDGHHGVAPVSYILEWGDLGDGQGKRPFRIERADGAAMAVPALVGAYWEAKDTRAFALVTIAPNRFVGSFHDRMIGQLDDDRIDVWLHPDSHARPDLRGCLRAPADADLVAYPLDAKVGSAKFDDPSALKAVGKPITWDDVKENVPRPSSAVPSAASGKDGRTGDPAKRAATPAKARSGGRTKQATLGGD